MDKRETVEIFRTRLLELIAETGLSRSRFAQTAGLDRSTLSQLLSGNNVRLPRSETLARIAARHTVSLDWLLGLSQHDQVAADIVPQLAIEADAGGSADERLQRWHEEAVGRKIRYVPATLPDQLKSQALIGYESGAFYGQSRAVWSGNARERIEHAGRPGSEIDVCSSLQSLQDFAAGAGIWKGFPVDQRHAELEHMAARVDALYPTHRWFLFDGLANYSVPYTVFGQKRAAVYIGEMYFVFTSTEHIRELIGHFDRLIRNAVVQPNEASRYIAGMAKVG